jgi:hypothetical protein
VQAVVKQLAAPWLRCRQQAAVGVANQKTTQALAQATKIEMAAKQIKSANTPARCFICTHQIRLEYNAAERKRLVKNLRANSTFCSTCHLAVCKKHRPVCPRCLQMSPEE